MINLVQSKVALGTSVTLDSPVTAGNTVIAVASYSSSSADGVLYPVSSLGEFDFTRVEHSFSSGRGLAVFFTPQYSSGSLEIDWSVSLSSTFLVTAIFEFYFTSYDQQDMQVGTTLTTVLFPDALDSQLVFCAVASDDDSCIFNFPIGNSVLSYNGSGIGAIGAAYRITVPGIGTISSTATGGNTLWVANRILGSEPISSTDLTIECGTLVQIGIS